MATFASLVPPLRTTVLVGSPGADLSGPAGACRLGLWETPEVQLADLAEAEGADVGQGFESVDCSGEEPVFGVA